MPYCFTADFDEGEASTGGKTFPTPIAPPNKQTNNEWMNEWMNEQWVMSGNHILLSRSLAFWFSRGFSSIWMRMEVFWECNCGDRWADRWGDRWSREDRDKDMDLSDIFPSERSTAKETTKPEMNGNQLGRNQNFGKQWIRRIPNQLCICSYHLIHAREVKKQSINWVWDHILFPRDSETHDVCKNHRVFCLSLSYRENIHWWFDITLAPEESWKRCESEWV